MGSGETVRGVVTEGLGEGKFFMSLPRYKKEIMDKLGFDAFPGTLNLRIEKNKSDLLENQNKIVINGFEENGQKFEEVYCFKAKIKNISGAIIIPEITKHKNTLEFISDKNLRQELKLENEDNVKIILMD
ncbi:CTP-dependent riboflavin kinase [Candidatus Woesearchaeota archaeon]|nr:CTP-dependent riboflavin kinase [Candidatus Woesearchaeota archaeon]